MTTTTTDTEIVRFAAKLYADNPGVIDLAAYVPLFHGWIQRRILDGTPIDVADYAHVPDGPGIMLIGHEADRSLDMGEGRPGVLYARKREPEGTVQERIAAAILAVDEMAGAIESDPAGEGVRFGRNEILLQVNDRLRVPNEDASLEALRPAIEAALAEVRPGRTAALERAPADPRGPLRIRITLS